MPPGEALGEGRGQQRRGRAGDNRVAVRQNIESREHVDLDRQIWGALLDVFRALENCIEFPFDSNVSEHLCGSLAAQKIVTLQVAKNAGDMVPNSGCHFRRLIPHADLRPARAKLIAQARPTSPLPTIATLVICTSQRLDTRR